MRDLADMLVLETSGPMADLVDELAESQETIIVAGRTQKAVMITEDNWEQVQEALYLLSVPGMRESISQLIQALYDDCEYELSLDY